MHIGRTPTLYLFLNCNLLTSRWGTIFMFLILLYIYFLFCFSPDLHFHKVKKNYFRCSECDVILFIFAFSRKLRVLEIWLSGSFHVFSANFMWWHPIHTTLHTSTVFKAHLKVEIILSEFLGAFAALRATPPPFEEKIFIRYIASKNNKA